MRTQRQMTRAVHHTPTVPPSLLLLLRQRMPQRLPRLLRRLLLN
jgi:hypothetical protein